jgi:hypothetical protein
VKIEGVLRGGEILVVPLSIVKKFGTRGGWRFEGESDNRKLVVPLSIVKEVGTRDGWRLGDELDNGKLVILVLPILKKVGTRGGWRFGDESDNGTPRVCWLILDETRMAHRKHSCNFPKVSSSISSISPASIRDWTVSLNASTRPSVLVIGIEDSSS